MIIFPVIFDVKLIIAFKNRCTDNYVQMIMMETLIIHDKLMFNHVSNLPSGKTKISQNWAMQAKVRSASIFDIYGLLTFFKHFIFKNAPSLRQKPVPQIGFFP